MDSLFDLLDEPQAAPTARPSAPSPKPPPPAPVAHRAPVVAPQAAPVTFPRIPRPSVIPPAWPQCAKCVTWTTPEWAERSGGLCMCCSPRSLVLAYVVETRGREWALTNRPELVREGGGLAAPG